MKASLFPLFFLIVAASPGAERQSLGIFSQWGAFRENDHCFAIAEPDGGPRPKDWKPFAAVASWPARGVSGQIHFRLSREKRQGSAVLLRIDDRTFQLMAGGINAWAPDAGADAEIVAAMRSGIDMSLETRSSAGALVRDYYRLRGAATAIDAAAIACAARR